MNTPKGFLWRAWGMGSQFTNQGLNPQPLQWKHRVLTSGRPGKLLNKHLLKKLKRSCTTLYFKVCLLNDNIRLHELWCTWHTKHSSKCFYLHYFIYSFQQPHVLGTSNYRQRNRSTERINNNCHIYNSGASLVAQLVKNLPALQETLVRFLGLEERRDRPPTPVFLGFPGGSDGKESTCNAETWVWSLGWEDPLEEGMATHSSILGLPRWFRW